MKKVARGDIFFIIKMKLILIFNWIILVKVENFINGEFLFSIFADPLQLTTQDKDGLRHYCPNCNRSYKQRSHMHRHFRYECGIPQRFECPYCKYHYRQRTNVWYHIRTNHPNKEMYCVDIVTNDILFKKDHKSD